MREGSSVETGSVAWAERVRASGIPLILVAVVPFLFLASMVLQGYEPPAADTHAARPYSDWGRQCERTTGQMPDWYPSIFCGLPSYGSFTYTPRSPIHPLAWVQRMAGDNRGFWYAFLFSLAGWGVFVFLRRQGFSRLASTTAAILYGMTPYFLGCVAAGHSTKLEALALVPWFLWAIDLFVDAPGGLRMVCLAAVAAALAWSNHPQVAYYAGIIGTIYAVARLILERRTHPGTAYRVRLGAYLLGAIALALALAAEPFLAVREYAAWSIRGGGAAGGGQLSGGVGWDYATGWSFHPRELISLLVPGWFGFEGGTYWGPMPFTQSTHYFGILTVLFALFGLWRMRSPRRWIWAAISAVILLMGFGRYFPVLFGPMFRLLPLFNKFRVPSMVYSVLPFCLAFLVAGGVDELWRLLAGDPSARPDAGARKRGNRPGASPARPFLWVAAAAAVLWLLLGLGARGHAGGAGSFVRAEEATRYDPAQLESLRAERLGILEASLAQSMLAVLLAAGALAWGARSGRKRAPLVLGIVSVLAVGDVVLVSRQFYHVAPRADARSIIPLHGACEFLSRQPGAFRIMPASRELFSSNAFGLMGLESVGGYHPAKLRAYQDLLDANLISQPAVLKMLNVRYILSPSPIRWAVDAAYQADGCVYPWPDSLPRAWAVSRVETVSGFEQVRSRLGGADFDPAQTALVYSGDAPAGGEAFAPAEVRLVGRRAGRVRLSTQSDGTAFVVVSEPAFPPGWKATVDGKTAPIHRVNHVLQGIEVPAGSHEVQLTMHSRARVAGARVSRVAGTIAFLLALTCVIVPRLVRGRADAAARGRAD